MIALNDYDIPLSPTMFEGSGSEPMDYNDMLAILQTNPKYMGYRSAPGTLLISQSEAANLANSVRRAQQVLAVPDLTRRQIEVDGGRWTLPVKSLKSLFPIYAQTDPLILDQSPTASSLPPLPQNHSDSAIAVTGICLPSPWPLQAAPCRTPTPDLVYSVASSPSSSGPSTPRLDPVAVSEEALSYALGHHVDFPQGKESPCSLDEMRRTGFEGDLHTSMAAKFTRTEVVLHDSDLEDVPAAGDIGSVCGSDTPLATRGRGRSPVSRVTVRSTSPKQFPCPICATSGHKNIFSFVRVLNRHLERFSIFLSYIFSMCTLSFFIA